MDISFSVDGFAIAAGAAARRRSSNAILRPHVFASFFDILLTPLRNKSEGETVKGLRTNDIRRPQ